MIVCLLIGLQTFATSDDYFDLNVDLTVYPATCGEDNGAITTTVSGGVPPYIYMWSNGQVSTGIVNLAPGNYSVTVTDGIGNTATASATVIGYPGITISSVIVVEATCGNNDGFAIINVNGNPDDYIFDWSPNVPSSNGPIAIDLSSGTYSVTITDPSQPEDCSLVETFTVGNVDGPETTLVTTASVCGEDNGSATFGEPNYDYAWDPDLGTSNAEGNIRTDLPAGEYYVTITDPTNPACDNVKTVVIDEIPSITVDYTVNNLPDCGIANGSVTINANGGSGNYSYSWGSATVNNLAAGTYEVTVTDTDTGCTGSIIFTLLDSSGGATVTVDDVVIACAGDMDGTVQYTVTYGPGFSFPADTIIQDANGNEFVNGSLSPGSYCVVIKDANGCFSGSDCFEIEAPTQIDADLAIVDETCNALGSITIEITGGAGGYTYEWDPPQNPSGPVASNLPAGVYSVTITDANGCSGVADNLIVEDDCPPPPCALSIESVVVVEASCGESNGFAIVTAALDPDGDLFEYTWSSNVGSSNKNKATNLSAGTYSVTIVDITAPPGLGCTTVETFTVGNIDGPESDYNVTPTICGVDDGTVTFAEQSFNYTWNPNLGTALSNYERIDLPGGEYYITITDPANPTCEDVITVVVEEESPLTVTALVNTNPDCGAANGSATINVLGGSGDYSYSWGSQTENDLEEGIYTVVVTDNVTGCIGSVTFALSVNNPQADVTINSIDSLLCSGDVNSSVDFTVTYDAGFALPADTIIRDAFGLEYDNGTLPAGSYCVLIFDANGCQQAGDCFEIGDPPQIDVDISIYPVECDSFGLISLAITGGTPPYEVLLDGAPIPPGLTIDDLDPGTYILTVTDANDCSIGAVALFVGDNCDEPCNLSISSVVVVEASCGNTDGSAIVNVAGDPNADIYNYTWSSNVGGSTLNYASNLSAGTYSVTIVDPSDTTCYLIETFTVGNIDGPESDYEVTSAICGVNDGTVTFAEQSFNYAWDPDLGDAPSNYERINLPGGEYFITITDPANPGCEDVITVVVDEVSPLTITPFVNNAPDCDSNDGSVTINTIGGTGDYTIDWGPLIGIGATITNLGTGVYQVTVTDNNTGCFGILPFSLNADNPTADITINSIDSLLCSGDLNSSVDFTVNYDPTFAFPADTLIVDPLGNIYTNGALPAGSYCVLIFDANGCQQAGDCFEIGDPPQIDVDISIYPVECDSFGLISLAITGGTPPYQVLLDGAPIPPGLTIDDLDPGTYILTVADANDCSVGAVALFVGDNCPCPDIYLESVLVIEASCGNADGFAQVNVAGNPDDYTYTWSANVNSSNGPQAFNLEAGTYSVTIADITYPDNCFIIETFTVGNIDGPDVTYTSTPSDCSQNNGTVTFSNASYEYTWSPDVGAGAPSNIRTDLPAGIYFVTVVDPAVPDCPDVITVVVEEVGFLDVEAIINQNPDCGDNNGSVTINASGGSGNYSYSWGTQTVNNLAEGTYEVTVTDNDTGCTGSVLFVLTSNNPQATVTIDDEPSLSCSGDNDGFVGFTVAYSGGFAFPADTLIQDVDGNIYTNGNLPSGSYCIVITDANGCFSGGDCFEIEEPAQIDVDISIYPQDCDTLGSISVVVTGGAGGYTYEWDPAQNPSDSIFTGLDPGNYGLTITDGNGCSVDAGNLIVGDDCSCEPVVIDGLLILNASCGNNDGFAFISIDGGPAGFTYTWSSNVTNPAGPFAFDLAAGTYSVTVADENFPNNCFVVETFTVGNADGPMVTYDSTPTECGETDGTVTLSNPNYEYAWDPDIGTVVSNYERIDLPAGEYYITVTDTLNPQCPNVITVIVEELDALTVTATINQNPDCAQANGSATINVLGGTGDYSYSWGGPTVTNLEAGIYVVTVTDNNTGCQGIVQFSLINSDPQATVTINSVSELLCPGDEDGTVDFTVTYGPNFEFPDSVVIVDALGNIYQNGFLGPGSYCINVYDASGCLEASECFEIAAPSQINVVVEIENENCDSLGSITLVDVNGGAGGYTYEWDPPITTDSLATNLEPGDYGITVTDANGCSISGVIPIQADTNKITIDLMPDTLICDTSIIIDVTITPESATVVWTDEDGNPFDPSLPVSPVDTSIYYVEVTSGECFARDSVIIIEGAVNIQVEYDSITCVGSDSVISIINLDAGDSLMYDWGPDSLIVMDGNEQTGTPTINTNTTGDYSIFYDVTNQYGCNITDTLEILVVDSLIVDTIVSTMQCDSTTVDFSVNESPFVIYVWNFGDPGNPGGAIGPNPSHTYSDSGCYTVTLIMLPNSSASCFTQDTILHEVCVVAPPLVDLGIDVSVDCNDNGAEVTLEDVSTSVLGDIIAWEWTIDGDSVSNDSIVILDVPQSDTLEVEMIVLNEEGCIDTLLEAIPINIIDIEFPDSILACEDDFIQLYNGSDTTLVFEWSPPGIFDDPNDPHAVAHITEDVVITVSISDTMNLNSCPQDDTIQITLADPINLLAFGDSIFCDESDAPLSIGAGCGNCDENMMEWSTDPNFDIIEGTGPIFDNPNNPGEPMQEGIYFVRIVDTTGCSEMDSVMLLLDDIPLDAPPEPTDICFGDTTLISISPLDSVEWIWEGENIIYTDNPNEILVYPTGSQYYTYTVINENGCEATDSALVNVVDIGMGVTATADPTEICVYETTQLNVDEIPGATYLWSNGETLNDSTIHNPVGSPLVPTTYDVIITDEDSGCATVASVTVSVVHPACEEPYVFFPNAFTPNGDGHNDVLYLRGSDVTEVNFIIYNRWGEKMFESNSQGEGWDGTFNGKELGSDVYGYYLRVRCGNGEEFIKKGNVTILK